METRKQKRIQFFNDRAPDWDNYAKHDPKKIRFILDKLSLNTGQNILDVGCGTGILTPFIMELIGDTGKLTSIDVSPEMIKVAKSKFPEVGVEFLCDDIHTIKFPSNSFDAITFYSVFPHIDEKVFVIKRCAEFLKPGGKITVAHSQSRAKIMSIHEGKNDTAVSHDYFPKMTEIEEMFVKSGLSVIFKRDDEEMFVITGEKQ